MIDISIRTIDDSNDEVVFEYNVVQIVDGITRSLLTGVADSVTMDKSDIEHIDALG